MLFVHRFQVRANQLRLAPTGECSQKGTRGTRGNEEDSIYRICVPFPPPRRWIMMMMLFSVDNSFKLLNKRVCNVQSNSCETEHDEGECVESVFGRSDCSFTNSITQRPVVGIVLPHTARLTYSSGQIRLGLGCAQRSQMRTFSYLVWSVIVSKSPCCILGRS